MKINNNYQNKHQSSGFGAVLVKMKNTSWIESTIQTNELHNILNKLEGKTDAYVNGQKSILKFERTPSSENAAISFLANMKNSILEKMWIKFQLSSAPDENPDKLWQEHNKWLFNKYTASKMNLGF